MQKRTLKTHRAKPVVVLRALCRLHQTALVDWQWHLRLLGHRLHLLVEVVLSQHWMPEVIRRVLVVYLSLRLHYFLDRV